MLTFVSLIVARWLGWSAPNLSQAEALKLWDIVEVGRGVRTRAHQESDAGSRADLWDGGVSLSLWSTHVADARCGPTSRGDRKRPIFSSGGLLGIGTLHGD
ncbi:MAG TPA: hypothetical protein PKM43_18735 [Verrucomicrobiota bacterium]|jgi:hypothetical protein|nr:hypothetical protein [Verrucomicrobiota bacterium]